MCCAVVGFVICFSLSMLVRRLQKPSQIIRLRRRPEKVTP
jgi:hypothetical protein